MLIIPYFSQRHLRRLLTGMNLSRRKHYSDIGEVVLYIHKLLKGSGKLHGYRWMYHKCQLHGYNVRKEDVRLILSCLDPEGVNFRKARRLHRRAYYASGPNRVWHFDGHDKLRPYGFGVSGCIDGYSRKLIWVNIYTTNSDPKVIGGYYIEAIEKLGGCPTCIRGDRGTENVRVKTFQQVLMRNVRINHHATYLEGPSTANQRIESFWGHLRKQCLDYYMILFHDMQEHGHYLGDFVDKNLFIFCFLGVLQVSTRTSFVKSLFANNTTCCCFIIDMYVLCNIYVNTCSWIGL